MEYEKLSTDELNNMLSDIEEELEELAIERKLTLGGTGLHIGAAEVQRIRNDIERSENRVLEKKALILNELGKRES